MRWVAYLRNFREKLFVSTVSYTSPFPSAEPPFETEGILQAFREAWNNPDYFFRAFIESDVFLSFKKFLAFVSMVSLVIIIIFYPKLVDATWRLKRSLQGSGRRKAAAHPPRWNVVVSHLESGNEAEWKIAIMEADSILAGLMRASGYHGDTLGEMLKGVDRSDIPSIESAWEAHRIRNQIAHEGSRHSITLRETRRIIGLYENVFRDFGYL